jgi:hypothetical protein
MKLVEEIVKKNREWPNDISGEILSGREYLC